MVYAVRLEYPSDGNDSENGSAEYSYEFKGYQVHTGRLVADSPTIYSTTEGTQDVIIVTMTYTTDWTLSMLAKDGVSAPSTLAEEAFDKVKTMFEEMQTEQRDDDQNYKLIFDASRTGSTKYFWHGRITTIGYKDDRQERLSKIPVDFQFIERTD